MFLQCLLLSVEMKKKPNPRVFGISVLDHCNAERMALTTAYLTQLPEKGNEKRANYLNSIISCVKKGY